MTFKPTSYPEDDLLPLSKSPAESIDQESEQAHAASLISRLSVKTWMLIVSISLVLCAGSAAVLFHGMGESGKDRWALMWESIPAFIKRTVELTWEDIKSTSSSTSARPFGGTGGATSIAPNTKAGNVDNAPRKNEMSMEPVAAPRLRDPQ